MTIWQFTAAVALAGAATGFLGSLTGLGGGFIVVPVLTLGFGVDLRYAIGASLICIIATSTGSAARFVRDGFSNIRIGMFLEVATTGGAVLGAWVAPALPAAAISGLFGAVLLYAAYQSTRRTHDTASASAPDRLDGILHLSGSYPAPGGPVGYSPRRVSAGFAVMTVAGMLTGLIGAGSGLVKVIALDQVMGLPFKVAATTSSFMIGVTAAAAAGVHLSRGNIDPAIAMPIALGVLAGTLLGARVLPAAKPRGLRLLFAVLLAAVGFQMLYSGVDLLARPGAVGAISGRHL
jgi:uncharacterized membrane protein YfcA